MTNDEIDDLVCSTATVWYDCEVCQGTGVDDGAPCVECDGCGEFSFNPG